MLGEATLAIVALNLVFSVWMMRVLALQINSTVGKLDHMLAEAISKLIERGLGEIEPVNPIQQAIASMIQNNLQRQPGQSEVIEVPLSRDSSGKFS